MVDYLVILIPWLPAAAALVCGVIALCRRELSKFAPFIAAGAIGASFLIAFMVVQWHLPEAHEGEQDKHAKPQAAGVEHDAGHHGYEKPEGLTVTAFEWIQIGGRSEYFATEAEAREYAEAEYLAGSYTLKHDDTTGGWMLTRPGFVANFSYFIDPLTILMLFVVCGIGTLVTIYAAGYMKGDKGYARFFAYVCLFIFAMTNLVMADNLVLLYLGWEGVGLCSYLLIGFYYQKPSAVAAAKKAFIVNRIGDLGFALGIFMIYQRYGTVVISDVLSLAPGIGEGMDWRDTLIPFLLMLGAFGKSAQIPLYVWLPDAMEGPTPVSALIHAATMVTAGVYMIARLMPVFAASEYALPTVATIGGVTAFFAATIALCQYDIKRIYAYSTISQLGYMFLGVGAFSAVGGVFHLFTHAFFKALLFLTAGSVMHALAGQLDLRKMSGLKDKMPVTCWLMFVGCLSLSAFPFITAGFWSKDVILAAALDRGFGETPVTFQNGYAFLGILALITALLTAFYTFRLWFRVFLGPQKWEMGDEHHGDEHDEAHGEGEDEGDVHVEHHHEPHEMPWLMNAPLVVLAIGAVLAGFLGMHGHGWVGHSIEASTAGMVDGYIKHAVILDMPMPTFLIVAGMLIAIIGIGGAAWFHWLNREAADEAAERFQGAVKLLENKYYVDEANDKAIVKPLHLLGQIFFICDRMVVEGLVYVISFVPRLLGRTVQPLQRGVLQGYGLTMVAGLALALVLIVLALN